MISTLSVLILSSIPVPSPLSDCIIWQQPNRQGAFQEWVAPAQNRELPSGWNDTARSLWVRAGFYSMVSQHQFFQGEKLYFYGTGLAFHGGKWEAGKGQAVDGGTLYNLEDFKFQDTVTSILCLKH